MLHHCCQSRFLVLATVLLSPMQFAAGQPAQADDDTPVTMTTTAPFVLGPPMNERPVIVWADFQLNGISNIDDEAETFEFTGILTFRWTDRRQAFDPAEAGVNEKIFQGNYQFNEVSPGWFPQEFLVNQAGTYEKDGVVLRVKPDGTNVLVQTVSAVAKSLFVVRRYPFDRQQLEARFELLGFDQEEVVFRRESDAQIQSNAAIRLSQWNIEQVGCSVENRPAGDSTRRGAASTLVLSIDVRRESFFMLRLVVLPLMVIVLLSFSVFWMDRSSLGDRINVSFIGILTGVAYQIVMGDIMPHISSFSLINAFLNISFFTMCATVGINLIVGALDKKGMIETGDRLDRRCRWIFPLAYFGLILLATGGAYVFF